MKPIEKGDMPEYYERYANLVSGNDVLKALETQVEESLTLFASVDEERAGYRYAPDKWSIKELLGHIIDTERIFATRGMALARGDTTPLPGFEQDDYVAGADFDRRPWKSLVDEFRLLRASNALLFRSLEPKATERVGTVSGSSFRMSAVPWVVAGHELWHRKVLEERYLA